MRGFSGVHVLRESGVVAAACSVYPPRGRTLSECQPQIAKRTQGIYRKRLTIDEPHSSDFVCYPTGASASPLSIAYSRRHLNRLELANVLCGKVPVPGTLDDKSFVIVTGQWRIELGMTTIEANEERPFRITVRPYVMVFASVIVLVVTSSRSKAFVLVEVS